MKKQNHFALDEKLSDISRRDFMKFCGIMAVSMGLPIGVAPQIAEAITNPKRRPPVIWLHGQECTGCTESLLWTSHPSIANLILELISLDYHETLEVGAGHQAEAAFNNAVTENAGKFILVIEGSVPVKDGGIYCKIGGRPFTDIVKETAAKAAAIVAIGSCASWGGVQSSEPNPTGATGCERRPHFDAGRFAEEFGDEGHRKGYCLFKLGCKGPMTYANCPSILFNEVGSGAWPVGTGHPCFGCVEEGIGFTIPQFTEADVEIVTPAAAHAPIRAERGAGVSKGSAALLGGIAGAAIGAGAVIAKRLGDADKGE